MAAVGALEGKNWIIELKDNKEQIKITEFNLLSFLLLLFYFIIFYI